MKKIMMGILPMLLLAATSQASPQRDSAFQLWILDAEHELLTIHGQQQLKVHRLQDQLSKYDDRLISEEWNDFSSWMPAYRERIRLERRLATQTLQGELSTLKVRYRKGIDLIKLLYEKILALDHHFSSMQTYQHIMQISNPNAYPEFKEAQSVMEQRLKRKNMLQLPSILQSNPYVTMAFSIVTSLVGDGAPSERKKELDQISCILDFTVRMNADLKIIRHETEYLQKANQQLKEACERLFTDYVDVVDYLVPLENCRNQDDWESLYLKLDQFTEELKMEVSGGMGTPRWGRQQVNLEFATQRVAEFISQYSQFINQGIQYYEKFNNIVANYEYEDQCRTSLPSQFEELRADIVHTIEKFENTYDLPEIQGSRMKDLLYGQVE